MMMLTRLSLFYLSFLYLLPVTAQHDTTKGIRFAEDNWATVLQKAHKGQKLIFLDCYTSWCGPCKRLAREVFTNDTLGSFYNQHFVNVGMDMEKGEGVTLAVKLDVDFYPTLFVLNEKGYILAAIRGAGGKNVQELLSWAKEAVAAKDSLPFQQRFDAGLREPSFMLEYAAGYVREGHNNRVDSILQQVVNEKGYQALLQQEYYRMLPVLDLHAPLSVYFTTHSRLFAQKFTADDVYGRIAGMYTNFLLLYRQLYSAGLPHVFVPQKYNDWIDTLKSRNLPDFEFFKAQVDFFVECRAGNFEKAFAIGNAALKKGAAWKYYAMAKQANEMLQKEPRQKAVLWAEKAKTLSSNEVVQKDCDAVARDLKNLPLKPFHYNEGITTFRFP